MQQNKVNNQPNLFIDNPIVNKACHEKTDTFFFLTFVYAARIAKVFFGEYT